MKTSEKQGMAFWKREAEGSCGEGGCATCSTGCARTEGKKLWLLGTIAVAAISVVTGVLYTSRGEPVATVVDPAVQNVAFQIPQAWQIHPEQLPLVTNIPAMNQVALQPPPVMFAPWPGQNPGWAVQNQMTALTPVAMVMTGQGLMPMPTQGVMPMQMQGVTPMQTHGMMPMVMTMTTEGQVIPMVITGGPVVQVRDGMQ